MQKISFLFLGTSLSLIPTLTFAQCVATQDCETLGYTETSCNGGKGVKCPFGNKWACLTSEEELKSKLCSELGFTLDCSGENQIPSNYTCNNKYNYCNCADDYGWKDGKCEKTNQIQNGAQGNLYYCNGKVVGVRATGMGFYVALRDLGQMYWSSANSQCRNYSFCGNVKGTLPTREQLLSIYQNKSRVNSLLSTNGGTQLTNNYYWSSTYSGSNGYYVMNMSDGGVNGSYGYDDLYVRPVLASW